MGKWKLRQVIDLVTSEMQKWMEGTDFVKNWGLFVFVCF